LAVVWATENHRTLLLGNPFTLETDYNALKYLLAEKASVGRLARWSLKLQEFDMTVKYRNCSTLGAVDFMSGIKENPDGSYVVGAAVQPGLIEGDEPPGVTRARVNVILQEAPPEEGPKPFLCSRDFELAQANCPWVSALLSFVRLGGLEIPADREHARWAQSNQGNLLTQKGLLFRCTHCATGKGKLTRQINALLVPAGLRTRVLELAHSHPIYGHKGGQATYHMIKNSYFWPGMKADTLKFVHQCSFCLREAPALEPGAPPSATAPGGTL
jgi:hypothetical protein